MVAIFMMRSKYVEFFVFSKSDLDRTGWDLEVRNGLDAMKAGRQRVVVQNGPFGLSLECGN